MKFYCKNCEKELKDERSVFFNFELELEFCSDSCEFDYIESLD